MRLQRFRLLSLLSNFENRANNDPSPTFGSGFGASGITADQSWNEVRQARRHKDAIKWDWDLLTICMQVDELIFNSTVDSYGNLCTNANPQCNGKNHVATYGTALFVGKSTSPTNNIGAFYPDKNALCGRSVLTSNLWQGTKLVWQVLTTPRAPAGSARTPRAPRGITQLFAPQIIMLRGAIAHAQHILLERPFLTRRW